MRPDSQVAQLKSVWTIANLNTNDAKAICVLEGANLAVLSWLDGWHALSLSLIRLILANRRLLGAHVQHAEEGR